MVERLFLAVPWGCLRFVIVVFPDHTCLLFLGQLHSRISDSFQISNNYMTPIIFCRLQLNLQNYPAYKELIFMTLIYNLKRYYYYYFYYYYYYHYYYYYYYYYLLSVFTHVPAKSDSDAMFCLQSYQAL